MGVNTSSFGNGRKIGGEFQYAIDPSAVIKMSVGIGLLDNSTLYWGSEVEQITIRDMSGRAIGHQSWGYEVEQITIPPYPLVGIAFEKRGRLGQTQLSYFSHIGFGAAYGREIREAGR